MTPDPGRREAVRAGTLGVPVVTLEEALERARAGDGDALADVYRALSGPLLSYLATQVRRREDAEDLVGEVFVAVVRDVARFEGDATGFRAWVYRIATNRAIDHARRVSRRPEAPLAEADERPDPADPEEQAIARAERERVWRAVRGLPEQQRRVIGLRLAAGLTSAEIAAVLGKGLGAVKAIQHRALRNLARSLGASSYPRGPDPRFTG